MKIGVFETETWERDAFRALERENDLLICPDALGPATVEDYAEAEIVCTFIYSRISADVLERLPHLRLIATRSTGTDHIDLKACAARGVEVANVPSYGGTAVAEHVFALLSALSHRIVEAADRTRRGDFSLAGLQGFDLAGKTFGVVGTGDIGRHAARIATGYGMRALGYDLAPDEAAARRIGFDYVEFDTLLAESDVISLHVPGGARTQNLISTAEFERMKDGVVLINTARGCVIEVRALVQALASGKVAAAGLDVLPEEPTLREEAELLRAAFRQEHNMETLLADHILLRLNNVVITPHSAFNTREAVRLILETSCENIRSFLEGAPRNLVAA